MKPSLYVIMFVSAIFTLFACVSTPRRGRFLEKAKEMAATVTEKPTGRKDDRAGSGSAECRHAESGEEGVGSGRLLQKSQDKNTAATRSTKWADRLRKIGLGKKSTSSSFQ